MKKLEASKTERIQRVRNSFFICKSFRISHIAFAYCLLPIVCCFLSCSSGKQEGAVDPEEKAKLIAYIDSLKGKIFNSQTMELDKILAAKAIVAYLDFVKKFPDDSVQSAEYLFLAADMERGMGDYGKAIGHLGQICKEYPSFKKTPECLFLQGYYYQDFFKDSLHAKEFYMQLISKYPDHGFADDARELMKTFGKTDEDIIKGFEKKDAEKKTK